MDLKGELNSLTLEELKEYRKDCIDKYNYYNTKVEIINKIEKERINEIKDKIISDLTEEDTMHYEEAEYESFSNFLSDVYYGHENDDDYFYVLFNEFTEEELNRHWESTHKNKGSRN